jgi:hypothetical protein
MSFRLYLVVHYPDGSLYAVQRADWKVNLSANRANANSAAVDNILIPNGVTGGGGVRDNIDPPTGAPRLESGVSVKWLPMP